MARREIVKTGTYGAIHRNRGVAGPVETAKLVQAPLTGGEVVLTTGEIVPAAQFNTLTPAEQAYLRKFGVDAFNREQSRAAEQQVKAIAAHKTGEGYDLVGMVRSGYTTTKLKELGFDAGAVAEAKQRSDALVKMQPYETREGYDLVGAIEGKVPDSTLKLLFDNSAVKSAHQKVKELHDFTARNVEVAPGQWMAKAEWDRLTSAQKKEVKNTGAYTVMPQTGQQALAQLVKAGAVDPKAELASYDKNTGEVTYTVPTEKLPWYKAAWQFLSPWDESRGETALMFLKGQTLAQLVYSDVRSEASQAELKRQYEQQQNETWWQRLLSGTTVIPKTDKDTGKTYYSPVLASPAPAIMPVGAAAPSSTWLKILERSLTRAQHDRLAQSLRTLPQAPGLSASVQRSLSKILTGTGRKHVLRPFRHWTRATAQGKVARQPMTPAEWIRYWKPSTAAQAKVGVPNLSTIPVVIFPSPGLAKVPSVGIVGYKVTTPELAQAIFMPSSQTTVRLTPDIQKILATASRTMSRVDAVHQLGVIEVTELAKQEWLAPHEAATQLAMNRIATETMAQAMQQGQTQAQSQAAALAAIQADSAVQALTEGMTASQVQALTNTATSTATKAATTARTPTRARPTDKKSTRRRRGIRPPLPGGDSSKRDRDTGPEYPDGTITWRMGQTKRGPEWKAIPPPYDMDKPLSSTMPPAGVKVKAGTPQETLTFIGGKLPFKNVAFDLGVVDGFIDVKRRRIKFKGGGLHTNVGRRIPSRTRGVTLSTTRRTGDVYVTRFRGDSGVALSRGKPRKRSRRRALI